MKITAILILTYSLILALAIYANNLETYFACTCIGISFGVIIYCNEKIVKPYNRTL